MEDNEQVLEQERVVVETGHCQSNDHHVIALARVSGARVLFTEDKALMRDFGDLRLLRPKGKVYRRPSHSRLLVHRRGCRGRARLKS